VQELEPLSGFAKADPDTQEAFIPAGQGHTFRFRNQPLSAICVWKYDSQHLNVAIEGAVFQVCYLSGEEQEVVQVYFGNNAKGPLLVKKVSASDGKPLSDMEFSLAEAGRYYLRELENEGYVVDTQLKTVYVKAGETTEVTWENTPITEQIQVFKTSADYNSMNGWPAGTPIPGTVFEIYNYRTGNLVDTIRTDKNGVAVSKPLPRTGY